MGKIYDANSSYFDDGVSNVDASPNLHFDAGANTIVKIKEIQTSTNQKYTALELHTLKIKTSLVSIEDYSKYIDLMKYVPEKFRSSIALEQFMHEAGLMVGSWLSDINDLSILIDKYNVSQKYITYLANLIGFSFHTTPLTTFPQIQRQLIQAIDWYKMKGTYQAYKYIGFILGLNLNCYDLYTQDYINFIQEPWYAGPVGSLPPDVALNNPPGQAWTASTLTIGTGSKSFTVSAGIPFAANQNIAITYDKDNYMIGTLTSYNSGTGAIVVNITNAYGSGTYSSWYIPYGYYKSPHFGVQTILNTVYNYSANFLYNWSFETWSSGINNPPDGWTFSSNYSTGIQGVGGNQVVQGVNHVDIGLYSAQLVANQVGFYSQISQDVSATTGINVWKGKTVTFGCWVWAPTTATQTSLTIDDGVGTTNSSYHPADNQWHFLTVTRTISNSATTLKCAIKNNATTISTTIYADGAILLSGSSILVPPSALITYPGPDLWYLFDGSNTFSLLSSYINQVRPVNTVPQYGLSLTAKTNIDGTTTTVDGNVQTATIGSTWNSSQLFFDNGSTTMDNSQFFDFSNTGFYNSISTWKLGTGNKGVNPSNSGWALQNPVPGLTGTIPTPQIFADHIQYTITVPNNINQAGVSELGLYVGSTLEIGCTFPNINLVSGVQLTIYVNIYF